MCGLYRLNTGVGQNVANFVRSGVAQDVRGKPPKSSRNAALSRRYVAKRAKSCWGVVLMRPLVCVGALTLMGWAAHAEAVPFADDALKHVIAGKTVRLDTPFGVAIPITYQANGLMSGKAGLLEYFLGAETDRGRWWIAEGKLCQKWFKWLDAQPSCMRLKFDGHRVFWVRDDGLSGTATIAASLPPGVETQPRGLGGPAETLDGQFEGQINRQISRPMDRQSDDQSWVTTGQAASARPANLSVASTAHPAALKLAAVASPTPLEQPQFAQHLSDAGDWPNLSVNRARGDLLAPLGDEQDYAWCRLPVNAAVPDAPNLVLVARTHYERDDRDELPTPPRACLTAQPALRYVAEFGIDGR